MAWRSSSSSEVSPPGSFQEPGSFLGGAWIQPTENQTSQLGIARRVSPEAIRRDSLLTGSAAFRETFEETGILLHALPRAAGSRRVTSGEAGRDTRLRVQQGDLGFGEFLESLDVELNAAAVAYIGHWVTPATEPLRLRHPLLRHGSP